MKQYITLEDPFLCLDERCDVSPKLFQSATEMRKHKSHSTQSSLEEIKIDLDTDVNKQLIQNYLDENNLDLLLSQFKKQKKNILQDFFFFLDQFFKNIKRISIEIYSETSRKQQILKSIRGNEIQQLSQIQGEFSILLNIDKLPDHTKNTQILLESVITDILKLLTKIDKLFGQSEAPQINQNIKNIVIRSYSNFDQNSEQVYEIISLQWVYSTIIGHFRNKKLFLCLDSECGINPKLIQSASDMLQHKAHSNQRSLEEIIQDMNSDSQKKLIENFLNENNLDFFFEQIDEYEILCRESFEQDINQYFKNIKRQLKESYASTLRDKQIFNSIINNDQKMLSQIKGEFSILLRIKELPIRQKMQQSRFHAAKLQIENLVTIIKKQFVIEEIQ